MTGAPEPPEVVLEEPPPPRTVVAGPIEPSPWLGVVLTPVRGGAAGFFAAGLVLAAVSAWWEGGATQDDHSVNRVLQCGALLAGIAVTGVAARRVILCTLEDDRPVPWGRDERDSTTWMHDVSSFAAVLAASMAPALVASMAASVAGLPGWLSGLVALAAVALGAMHFPFALASTVLRNSPAGALPGGSRRAWKANRAAAKTAVLPTLTFLALASAGWVVGAALLPSPGDIYTKPVADHTPARDLARLLVFGLHAAALWAAFASFRVAGLLARDVPEIREVLA